MSDDPSSNDEYMNHEYIGPILTIRSGRCRDAIAFYKSAFGATEPESGHISGPDGRILNAHLYLCGGDLLLTDDFPENNGGTESPPPACVSMHLQVKDADIAWQRAIEAGATPIAAPANLPWGYRIGHLKDPFEHIWSIGSRKTA